MGTILICAIVCCSVAFVALGVVSPAEGILAEAAQPGDRGGFDLIIIEASEEWLLKNLLFGSIPDWVADEANCSVLMVRKYEPAPVSWLRRMIKLQVSS